MPNFKVRMLWPEGPSVQFYKYRQKLQSQKSRPSQSVTLSVLINYVHPLDGYAGGLRSCLRSSPVSWAPYLYPAPALLPAIRTPLPPAQPAPPYLLSPLGRPGVLLDGLRRAPPSWRQRAPWQEEASTRPVTDGRHVKTGNELVLGGHVFYLSCRGSFPASVLTTPCAPSLSFPLTPPQGPECRHASRRTTS